MNRLKAIVLSLLAVIGVSCQSGPGTIDNPKATPIQNRAALRAIVTFEEDTVITMHESGHLKPAIRKAILPIIAKQRAQLYGASAGWEEILDYIGYVPLVFSGIEVAQIVANAPKLTADEIASIEEIGLETDKLYDAAIAP